LTGKGSAKAFQCSIFAPSLEGSKIMQRFNIKITPEIGSVSAILQKPAGATALLVLSHGAGAGMEHPFMQHLADELATQNVATLRFNFPFMENGGPADRPPKAQATIQAAIQAALPHAKGLTLLAGGKSFGGRMTSQLAATGELPSQVKGIVYVGFPLHAPGKPGIERAAHLQSVGLPQLFLQGTRDTLAQFDLIEQVCNGLDRASLIKLEGADHSFQTLKRSGISPEGVMAQLAREIAGFAAKVGRK
jgi:predicted alpha/beta-hydrolase family hydrolase